MTKKAKKKLALGTLAVAAVTVAPIATVVSCGFGNDSYATNYLHDRREIHMYGALSSDIKQRLYDIQFTNGNAVTDKIDAAARVLGLMRTQTTGEDIGEISEKDGKMHWKSETKETMKLEGASKVEGSVDGNTWTEINVTKLDDPAQMVALKTYKKYKFTINPKGKTKWMDYQGNASKYKLGARDYFYGWMRSLYSAPECRDKGLINGNNVPNLHAFKKGWTTNDIDLSTNNSNSYMYDLFGVDVNTTIADGEKLTADSTEFVVSTKGGISNFLQALIADSSMFTPAPSGYIHDKANGSTEPSIKFGIANYGTDIKENLHVAAYYFSDYDGLRGYTVSRNHSYIDEKWNNDKTRIEKYVYHAQQKQDANAQIIQRKSGYEEGKESILDPVVTGSAKDFKEIQKQPLKYGLKLKKVVNVGLQQKIVWNALPNDEVLDAYNAKGRELMYGVSDKNGIKTNPIALDKFMNGDGAKLRHAMDLAYNWYAGAQFITSNPMKMALLSPLAPEQQIPLKNFANTAEVIAKEVSNPSSISPAESIYTRPSGVASYSQMKEHYQKNQSDSIAAATSPSIQKAIDLVKTFADKYAGAVIPIQTWHDKTKSPANQQTQNQFDGMIKVFNKIAPHKITFKKLVPNDWSKHLANFQHHDAQFQYIGWGPDYDQATSSLQGIMSGANSGFIIGQLLSKDFNSELNKEVAKPGYTDIKKTILEKLTLSDLKLRMANELKKLQGPDADAKKALFKEISTLVSTGFLNNASNVKFVEEMVQYLQDHALFHHTTFNGYTTVVTDRLQGSYAQVVQKTWLHTRTQKTGTIYLQDYSVDL